MFCLEENKKESEVIAMTLNQYSIAACDCRIHTHVGCWMNYIIHKGHTECPLCHRSLPQPQENQEIQVVYNHQMYQYRVPQTTGTIIIPVQEDFSRSRFTNFQKASCSMLILFSLILVLYILRF